MTGIAGANASEQGNVQTQSGNISTVQEKVNTQISNANIVNESTETQNTVDSDVKTTEKADINTSNTQTSEDQTQLTTKGTSNTQTTTTTSKNSENTGTNNQSETPAPSATNQYSINTDSDTVSSQTSLKNTSNIQEEQAAAEETKTATVSPSTVSSTTTVSEIKDAASRVKAYIETNKRLPKYVIIGTIQVQMPDFLKLMTAGLLQLNSGTNTPIPLKTVNNATKPVESIKSGSITKTGYLDLAKRVNGFIDANGKLPNYATSNLGKLKYESLIYMFSKIFNFEKTNSRLPSYVTVNAWSTIATSSGSASTPVPADLQIYLQATKNAQSNDPTIRALAAKITSGKTSTYDKASAIFNWVRDNSAYSFYYNTKYGAVGALKVKKGNCVDLSHLVIALSRAAGLPAKYAHGKVRFPSGNTYGHVWAEIWVNGKWYKADATSNYNTFSVMRGTIVQFKSYYRELPF